MPLTLLDAQGCFYDAEKGLLCSPLDALPSWEIALFNSDDNSLSVNIGGMQIFAINPDCKFQKAYGSGKLVWPKKGGEHSIECKRFDKWLKTYPHNELDMQVLLAELGILERQAGMKILEAFMAAN